MAERVFGIIRVTVLGPIDQMSLCNKYEATEEVY